MLKNSSGPGPTELEIGPAEINKVRVRRTCQHRGRTHSVFNVNSLMPENKIETTYF